MSKQAKKHPPTPKNTSGLIESFEALVAYAAQECFWGPLKELSPSLYQLDSGAENIIFALIENKQSWQQHKTLLAGQPIDHLLLCSYNMKSFIDELSDDIPNHSHLLTLPCFDYNAKNLIRFLISFKESREQLSNRETNVREVLSVSKELNKVRDTNRLLSLILEKCRKITRSDAGSIYIVKEEHGSRIVQFKVSQNDSIAIKLDEFSLPVNHDSVVGRCVIDEAPINIEDTYANTKAKHNSDIDKDNSYISKSMLTLPVFDIENQVIGVVQLINRKKTGIEAIDLDKDPASQIEAYDAHAIELAQIVCHQAGIALENAALTEEKQKMFEGFVEASIQAIEQRDPSTSGHSHRVAALTLSIARLVNKVSTGHLSAEYFNSKQLKEIEFASLLHDFGKIGVREKVLLKEKKLFNWQMNVLEARFETIRTKKESQYFRKKYELVLQGIKDPDVLRSLDEEFLLELQEVDEYFSTICAANEPTILAEGGSERLKYISEQSFRKFSGDEVPYISQDELKALSIGRGSLTPNEFKQIQDHVTHTYEFLRKIPWGKDLANVPIIAAKHHEKLDGSGYPYSLRENDIPIQSRMMTIADIFDALTASDRPYKKAVPVDKALDIISMDVKAGKCDPELFNLFIESKCYESVLPKPLTTS